MEEKKLSEQESLELISQMIRSTRKNMEVGSGNQFLYWGYFTAALSVLLFLLVYYTGDARWSIGWFSMFLFWGFMLRMQRKETPSVITYTDRAILQVWKVIGSLFVLTVVIMSLLAFHYGGVNFSLMLPLSLLYSGIGVSITGIIIRSRLVMWSPLVGFCFAIYMLIAYSPILSMRIQPIHVICCRECSLTFPHRKRRVHWWHRTGPTAWAVVVRVVPLFCC